MRLNESQCCRRAIPDMDLDTEVVRSLLHSSLLRKRNSQPGIARERWRSQALSARNDEHEIFGFSVGMTIPEPTTLVTTVTVPASFALATTVQPMKMPTPGTLLTPTVTSAVRSALSTSALPAVATTLPVASVGPTPLAVATTTATAAPTVFVTLQPPPPKMNGGLSETALHALIASGSIGATIIIVFIVWVVYRVKKGMRLGEACYLKSRNRYKSISEVTPPLGRWSVAGREWDRKSPIDAESVHERTMAGLADIPAALTRNGSKASQRSVQRVESPYHGAQSPARRPSAPTIDQSGTQNNPSPFGQAPLTRQNTTAASLTPSSPLLPTNAHIVSSGDSNHQHSSSQSSLPSYLRGAERLPPARENEVSHFSWTNSQAPRTPAADRDTVQRFSIATSRSSVPRFRTVESWVGNQTGRITEERLRETLEQNEQPVPEMPKRYRHRTNISDATVFRAHPGTEVVIPRASTIPSEVLDSNVVHGRPLDTDGSF